MNITVLHSFWIDEAGATMAEYGLMVALIAVLALGAVTALGVNVREVFEHVALTTALGG